MENDVILIVDDDKNNRIILSDLLQEHAKIVLAKNGEQAIEKAQKVRPSLILLDVIMPGIDGFETLELLKEKSELNQIPVIFITTLSSSEDEAKGLRLGACDYITKPFKSEIVLARVNTHLQLSRQRQLLDEMAHIDALTSIPNRRMLDEKIENLQEAPESAIGMTMVMVDIDYFKAYNDNYGHAKGDQILRNVANKLKRTLDNEQDLVCRYGGEEFFLLLGARPTEQVRELLEKCRTVVADAKVPHEVSDFGFLTLSMGAYTLTESDNSISDALQKADDMLYKAKSTGRNKVSY
jgi:diguanylate cyclase (GGDEF)-like protein